MELCLLGQPCPLTGVLRSSKLCPLQKTIAEKVEKNSTDKGPLRLVSSLLRYNNIYPSFV